MKSGPLPSSNINVVACLVENSTVHDPASRRSEWTAPMRTVEHGAASGRRSEAPTDATTGAQHSCCVHRPPGHVPHRRRAFTIEEEAKTQPIEWQVPPNAGR